MRPPRAFIAAGAAVLGLVAAPTIAGAGPSSDAGGQPPPGSSVEKTTGFRLGPQPPAGTKARKETDFRLGQQPVNRNPQPASRAPKAPDTDKGVENLPVTEDRGDKNLPDTRDRGAR